MGDYRIRQEDIDLLRRLKMDEEEVEHSIHVAEIALGLAKRTKVDLDMELIGRGGLFHDLGKVVTDGIDHGCKGAKKGAELGLPAAINRMMEVHIRGGLTGEEAEAFGLPVKDYTAHRLEERIVIYADRLADIIHDGIVEVADERDAEVRFKEILHETPKYGNNELTKARYFACHDEIQGLIRDA